MREGKRDSVCLCVRERESGSVCVREGKRDSVCVCERERKCVTCRKELFLKHTGDGAIDHSGGNESHLLGTDRDLVPPCKALVRKGCR